jgi:hypothetical protein
MLIPTMPFDYARLIDVTDRGRKTRQRLAGRRVRRATPHIPEVR